MKRYPVTAILVTLAGCGAPLAMALDSPVKSTFNNCSIDGGSANADGYQTQSEIYKCDEGRIELKGRWSLTIEYGYVFATVLGRPDGEPYRYPAPASGDGMFKWCPTPTPQDPNERELCGLIPPKKCWDGKPPKFGPSGDWTCKR